MKSLTRVWDYLMRRKPLLAVVFVALVGGFCGCQAILGRTVVNKEIQTPAQVAQTIDNGLTLQVFGENQVLVYQITLSDHFRQAKIDVNANSLASETYVRILDGAGNLIAGEYTTIYDQAQEDGADNSVKYYFPGTPKSYQMAVAAGTMIDLQAEYVRVYSTLDGMEVAELRPTAEKEQYIITANALQHADWDNEQAQAVMYQQFKRYATQQIQDYQATIPEHILYNKTLDVEKKSQVARLYEQLLPEDQTAQAEFLDQLRKGGVPMITYRGSLEYKLGDKVDFLELFDVRDNEDGNIAKENFHLEGAVDFMKPGNYDLICEATDSDGNRSQAKFTITVADESAEKPSQIPSEDRPADTPVDNNANPGDETNLGAAEGGVGAGVSVGETVANEATTVWGELEMRVDYEDSSETMSSLSEQVAGEEVIVPIQNGQTTPSNNVTKTQDTQKPHEATMTQPAETVAKKSAKSSVVFIAVGILVICGLVKFICDRYVR